MKYLAITAALCFVLAGISFAGNVTMTEVITGGNLTLTMPDNFSFSTVIMGVNGDSGGFTNSIYGYSGGPNFYVEDSRGTGVGWNLGFSISSFATSGTPVRTQPAETYWMSMNDSYIYSIYGEGRAGSPFGPYACFAMQNIQTSEVKTVRATSGYGMGKYKIYPTHSISFTPPVYAGTYTATLTATLNNVP